VSRPFLAVIAASYQEWYGQRLVKVSEILGTEESEGILRRAAALLRMTKDSSERPTSLPARCRHYG